MKAAELAKKIGAEVLISTARGVADDHGQDAHATKEEHGHPLPTLGVLAMPPQRQEHRQDAHAANEVEHVYAGDRVSDLLNHASGSTMLVSNLTSGQLIRIAELMEVAGICLVNGHRPCEEDLRVMSEHGVAVLVSPVGLFETCGRMYGCMFEKVNGKR
jgi:hypothetical protein